MQDGSVADDIRQSISEIVTLVLAFDEDFSVILVDIRGWLISMPMWLPFWA